MTRPELEEWFDTTGRLLLNRFYHRLQEYKKGLQFRNGGNAVIKLREIDYKVLELIKKGTKDTNALMERTGYGRRTIHQSIHKMIDAGMIVALGKGRSTTYQELSKGA